MQVNQPLVIVEHPPIGDAVFVEGQRRRHLVAHAHRLLRGIRLACEQIRDSPDGRELKIESGHYRAERRWQWPQQASSVLVTQCPHPWDPLQISLSHCGEYVAIGQFLNGDDSRRLLDALRQSGLPVRQFGADSTLAA